MKFNKRFILATAILIGLSTGFASCDDSDDSCSLTAKDCKDEGKKLNRKTCECVEKTCTLTCKADETLNEESCVCEANSTPEQCTKKCEGDKELDTAKCECVDQGTATCTLTCNDNERLDTTNCKCVKTDTPDTPACSKTCTDENQVLDTFLCQCVDKDTPNICTLVCNPETEQMAADECACVGKSTDPECDIKECPQGTELNPSLCKCVDPSQPQECTLTCEGDKILDTAKCICTDKDDPNVCTLTCSSEDHQTLDKDSCQCVCETGYAMSANVCNPINTCGNGQLDEGEFCDTSNEGNAMYASASDADCKKWQMGDYEPEGVPSCNDKCTGYKDAGTCVVKTGEKTCGNGKLDANEFCDTINNVATFSDPANAMCSSLGADFDPKKDGTPGCSDDCKKSTPGTCVAIDQSKIVMGFHSCSATFNYDSTNQVVTGYATYDAVNATPNVRGSVICGLKTGSAQDFISYFAKDEDSAEGKDGNISSQFSLADIPSIIEGLPNPKDYYGDYTCVFFLIEMSYTPLNGDLEGIICTDKADYKNKTMGEYNSTTYFSYNGT